MVSTISETFQKIDWKIVNEAEDILKKGKVVVQDFQSVADSFKGEYKRSNQDKVALTAKYESIALWAKMISEANMYLKDEFIRSQNTLRITTETILEVINKELKKDLNFQTENNELLCIEIEKQQDDLIQYLQFSILDQIKNEDSLRERFTNVKHFLEQMKP